MIRKSAPVLLLMAAAAVSLAAQDADPPSRVARLNLLSGSVSFRPGSVEDWTAATLNYPLTTGDHLWADSDSRTEMHVGSTAIRMGSRTAMSILNLDDRTTQLSLTEGAMNVRLRHLEDDESFEIDTPNVAITLLRPGDYLIEADGENNVTTVTVRTGDAEVTGGGIALPVHARQSYRLMGIDRVAPEPGAMAGMTEFDQWCMARDRHEDEARVSEQYVPRDMVGYEDLDDNGAWSEVPDYGWVWRPRVVAADWAPYRFGRWAWVEPWGWTWIDDAPWGFAPFHYGRWAMVAGGWVWAPGRMVVGVRPVYAPALVAFVGGPGIGVGIGVGGAGVAAWFPLGPHEVYRPAYHVSEVYVRQVNITHVTAINSVNVTYVNQRVPGAVTAVSQETFAGARPVGRSVVRVDAGVLARAQVVGTSAPIAPQRVSVMGHAGAGVAAPPARFVDHQVVARRPPPPPPVSFAAKQQALEANQGRPLAPAQVERIRPAMPERNPEVRTVTPRPAMAPPGRPMDRPGYVPQQPQQQRPTYVPPQQPQWQRPVPPPQRTEPQRTEPQEPPRPAYVPPPQRTEPQRTEPQQQPRPSYVPPPQPQRTEPPARPQQRVDAPPSRGERPAAQEQRKEDRKEDRKMMRKAEKEEKK